MPVFDWLLVARDSHFTATWPSSVSIACLTCVHTPTDTTACRPGEWEDRGPQQLAYAWLFMGFIGFCFDRLGLYAAQHSHVNVAMADLGLPDMVDVDYVLVTPLGSYSTQDDHSDISASDIETVEDEDDDKEGEQS